jgi:hypothetical protein
MKKTSKTVRAAILLLVLCMISTAMLGGTFAKYTSEYAGQDTALVARWSFTSSLGDEGTNIELPIWEHAYTTNILQQSEDDYLIAPGIQGEFTVDFTYDADVDANLIFNFTKSGVGATTVPLQYSLSSDFSTIYYSLDDLEDAIVLDTVASGTDGTYVIAQTTPGSPKTIDKTVYWRWPYNVSSHNTADAAAARTAEYFIGTGADIEGGKEWTDADDTAAGISSEDAANRDSYVLNLQIKATQIAPTTAVAVPIEDIAAISGTTQVGYTLTAGALTPDGAVATYQWQISDDDSDYTDISGATGPTYTLVAGDSGKYIKVEATGIEANGYSGIKESAAVQVD